jgi:hypothetical protein
MSHLIWPRAYPESVFRAGLPAMEDVDLAHASAPEVPAATHQCPAGNITPMRIHVSRPGFTVPASTPAHIWEVLGCKAATVRHIPAGVQSAWCRAQAAALDRFCDTPSESTLWGVLAMPKLVLRQVPLKGRHAKAHLADIMINRILAFERGEWAALWSSLQDELQPPGVESRSAKKARGNNPEARDAAVRRAHVALSEGSPGKALQQLLSPGIHDVREPAVWEALRKLHPQGVPLDTAQVPAAVDPDLGDTDVSGFWEPLVRDAIFSFPRSTAPGPSGLRASHLQDSVRRPGRGAPLVAALARLAHMWSHGLIPEDMGPALCGANLTPLRKKDGAVRPIAVGEILRRLVGKAILSTGVAKEEVSSLTPDQVGVG